VNEQLNGKQIDLVSMTTANESLQAESRDLKASLEVLETRSKQITEDNKKLEEDILNASKNCGDSAGQMTHLNEELQSKNKEMNLLREQESILTAESNKLVQQLEDYKEKSEKETATLNKEKDDEINKLEETLRKVEENTKQLKGLNDEMEDKAHKLELELQQSNSEMTMLTEENHSKEESLRKVSCELEGAREEVCTLKHVQEELEKATNEVVQLTMSNKEKENHLAEVFLQLEASKEKALTVNNEMQQTSESTQKELHERNNYVQELRLENESLRTNNETLTQSEDSLCTQLETSQNEKSSLTEQLNVTQQELHRIQEEKHKLLTEKDNVSSKHENFIEKSDQINREKEQLENEKNNLEKQKDELENKCLKLSEELQVIIKQHGEDKNGSQNELNERYQEVDELQKQTISLQNEIEEMKNYYRNMEQENEQLNEQRQEVVQRRKSLEDKVEIFNKMEQEMGAANRSMQDQLKFTVEREESTRLNKQTECSNLQIQVNEFIAKITVLENNNSLLQFELDELQQKNAVLMSTQNKKLSKKSSNSTEHDYLRDEVESLKCVNVEKDQEVEFLNSIIVDLQKKNKEQKDKIDILAYGDDIHELNGNGNHLNDDVSPVKSNIRIRMFCDICDLFDLHDTEDCPQQSNDFGGSLNNGKRGLERPYCVICETFGHTADNCDEEEMF